jgi:hypothetical protein
MKPLNNFIKTPKQNMKLPSHFIKLLKQNIELLNHFIKLLKGKNIEPGVICNLKPGKSINQ